MRRISARSERWPLAGAFVISRGAKTEAEVVVAEVTDGVHTGRGEAVPYARYGETVDGVLAQIAAVDPAVDRLALQSALEAGAARNALDCALWDLEAKHTGRRAWELAGLSRLDPVKTCLTISLGAPEEMAEAARREARRPMLKLKLGGPDDLDRVEAVRAAAPRTRLIVDANEAFTFNDLRRLAPDLARLDVSLIEQPLPAGQDAELDGWESPVPLCADETLHTRADLDACRGRYAYVNVKLDKAGGLSEALLLKARALSFGFEVMVGSMVSTSLAVAPALLVAQGARVVDLDGPLLLAKDREPGLRITGSLIEPPEPQLWG